MYQTISSDNIPSSSNIIKKPNNFKPNNTTTNHHHHCHHDNHQNDSQSSETIQPHISNSTNNQTHIHENNNSHLGSSQGLSGGDMLLQWGLRKRSRCSRMEGRSSTNHIMPPVSQPCRNNVCQNGGASSSRVRPKDNGVVYVKETPPFLPTRNRNLLGDQMGCSSTTSPPTNMTTTTTNRPVSRSGGVSKRSPPKGSGGSIQRIIKSDDPLPSANQFVDGSSVGGGGGNGNDKMVVEGGKSNNGEVAKCPRIYLSLSKKEKEEDFYAMKGTKLPHRPKKRAKAVDRALQYIYPGLWLSELTRARYEVRERKSTKKVKRKGGLKGLENMDSESE